MRKTIRKTMGILALAAALRFYNSWLRYGETGCAGAGRKPRTAMPGRRQKETKKKDTGEKSRRKRRTAQKKEEALEAGKTSTWMSSLRKTERQIIRNTRRTNLEQSAAGNADSHTEKGEDSLAKGVRGAMVSNLQ